MVTLAAVRLTVPVNQAEETSRQLHIAQLATATYIVIYRVILFNWSRSKSVQDGKIPTKIKQNFSWNFTFSLRHAFDFIVLVAILPSPTLFGRDQLKRTPCTFQSFCYKLHEKYSVLYLTQTADRPIWGVWQLSGPSNTLAIEIATHIDIANACIAQCGSLASFRYMNSYYCLFVRQHWYVSGDIVSSTWLSDKKWNNRCWYFWLNRPAQWHCWPLQIMTHTCNISCAELPLAMNSHKQHEHNWTIWCHFKILIVTTSQKCIWV